MTDPRTAYLAAIAAVADALLVVAALGACPDSIDAYDVGAQISPAADAVTKNAMLEAICGFLDSDAVAGD